MLDLCRVIMEMEKLKRMRLKFQSGKSEYHVFAIKNGTAKKTYEPCICKHNIDFTDGCVANFNPFFRSSSELIDGDFFSVGMEKILNRLEEVNRRGLDQVGDLLPDIPSVTTFSSTLKGKIFQTLEQLVAYYKREYNSDEGRATLDRFMHPQYGLLHGVTGCEYCYASRKNVRRDLVRDIDWDDFKAMLEQTVQVTEHETRPDRKLIRSPNSTSRFTVRLGKTTEAASLFHLRDLHRFLTIISDYNVSVHIPTKFLPFEPSIARLLKKTGSTIGYGFSYEALEPGPVLFGFDDTKRLETAQKYADAGVTTLARIAIDTNWSIIENERRGSNISDIAHFLYAHRDIIPQLIPFRMHGRTLKSKITRMDPKHLLIPAEDLFYDAEDTRNQARYEAKGNGEVQATRMHPDYIPLFTYTNQEPGPRRYHLCSDFGNTFYCDRCGIGDRTISIKQNRTRQVPVMNTKPIESKIARARRQKIAKYQRALHL